MQPGVNEAVLRPIRCVLIEKYANRRYPPRRRLGRARARIGALLKALLPERFSTFLFVDFGLLRSRPKLLMGNQ